MILDVRTDAKIVFILLTLFTAGCSMDFIPVHFSRINSARMAKLPVPRGPGTPGAFKDVRVFNELGGFLYDPTRISLADGARLKPLAHVEDTYHRESSIIETTSGPLYVSLHGFKESVGAKHKGIARYQLSTDGSKW